MSININVKDARHALGWLEAAQAIPLALYPETAQVTLTYDGEWISWATTGGTHAIESGHEYSRNVLWVGAKLKLNTDSSTYVFFLEPYKGNFSNYQGFDNKDGAQKVARSRKAGAETTTNLTDNWTEETDFQIKHEADQTDVYFYIDAVEKAHHTTNVSAQPFEICCCEPNAVARTVYLKYPPGMYFRRQ